MPKLTNAGNMASNTILHIAGSVAAIATYGLTSGEVFSLLRFAKTCLSSYLPCDSDVYFCQSLFVRSTCFCKLSATLFAVTLRLSSAVASDADTSGNYRGMRESYACTKVYLLSSKISFMSASDCSTVVLTEGVLVNSANLR